nr:unnamed protein product [Callosobruchus chinensis]
MNKQKRKVLCRPNNAQRDETTKLSRSPKDDVGLCLEVEMDEEVKDIITSPEKCASTLLDVTVIKPKEKTYTTQKRTMSGAEVRQFMAAMNVDPKQKQQHAEQRQYVDYSSGDGINNPSAKDKKRREKKCDVSEDNKVYYLDDPEFFEQIKYLLQRETEASSKGRKQCRVRELAKIIGRLVAACPAMRFGYLYTKSLEQEKYLALKHSKGAYDSIMQIRDHLKNDVEWRIRNLPCSNNLIRKDYASGSGWGAHANDISCHGFRSEEEKKHHINYVQQVYTTPKTFYDPNKAFPCENKYRLENDKPLSPCLCKNCAIVGIVTDSQKRPFATEDMIDPREYNPIRRREKEDPRQKRYVSFEGDHLSCQLYFKQLSARIRELEARLAMQEEKAVPKYYFRRIISQLVTHINKTVPNHVKAQSSTYRKYSPPEPCRDCRDKRDKCNLPYHRYVVQPMIIEEPVTGDYPVRTEAEKDPNIIPVIHTSAKDGHPTTQRSSSTWNWRDEILKPGIDLKNKIIALMEEKLNVLKWSKEKPKEDELKDFVDELSNNLYMTVNRLPAQKNEESKYKPTTSAPTGSTLKKEAVSFAYVNPKMSKWQEFQESKISIILKNESHVSINCDKSEIIQSILNIKEKHRRKLWKRIQQHTQSESDKVSIQFPRNHEQGENVQIEYTVGELKHLLLGTK